ncbi:MAG: S-layer homology domain-containing protein [Candidatus Margulisiibacteriota bacterium]
MTRATLLALMVLLLSSAAFAVDSDSLSVGARPISLGKAYVGLADDASAIFLNPAGLGQISALNLFNSYTSPHSDESTITLGAIFPRFQGVTAGLGYVNHTTTGIPMELPATVEVNYTEQEIVFSLAGAMVDRLAIGLNLDILMKGFSVDSPLLAANRGSGMDLDLGFLYQARRDLNLGLNFQNILPANLGGRFNYDSGASASLPANIKLGAAWKVRKEVMILLDLDKALERPVPLLWHSGVEWRPSELIAIRGGIDQTPKNGSETYTNFAGGIGLRARGITFDYTYYKSGLPTEPTTSYFAIGYKGEEVKAAGPTPEAVIPPSETLPPRVELAKFSDVPAGHPAREAIELMATAGLIKGQSDGTFQPDERVTQREYENIMAAARRVEPNKVADPDSPVPKGAGYLTRADLAQLLLASPQGQAAAKRLR